MSKAKHVAFLGAKKVKPLCENVGYAYWDRINMWAGQGDFEFDRSVYRRSFLTREAPTERGVSALPRQVYCFWTGSNELSANRKRSLESLKQVLGVPLVLVTPENLNEWVLPDHPLHLAYEYLSLVHRSDYLRAYFLHHHGGGYCDLKAPQFSWASSFDQASEDKEAWYTAAPITTSKDVVQMPGKLGRDLRRNFHLTGATHASVAWSHTPFSGEWLREVERRMSASFDQAKEYPGGARGETIGYPFSWHDLLAKILHPLCLKYASHIRPDKRLALIYRDYL